MEKLASEIKKLMIEKFNLKEDDIKLNMAKQIAEVIGSVKNPEEMAKKVFSMLLKNQTIPTEIRAAGENATFLFIKQFGYTYIKELMLEAARSTDT